MEDSQNRSKNLLSIDGGFSGLPAMYILEEICERLKWDHKLEKAPLPCEIFDLIMGTGKGAICALLLGKLKKSPYEAIQAYMKLESALSLPPAKDEEEKAANSRNFERVFTEILLELDLPAELPMLDEKDPKTILCTISTLDFSTLHPVRSYQIRSARPISCTVLQAARASVAALDVFTPMVLGDSYREFKLADATVGFANPIQELLQEAQRVYKGNLALATIVSLGAGKGEVARVTQDGGLLSQLETLQRISKNCKAVHERIYGRLHPLGIYFRFNPEFSSETEASSWAAHTSAYLQEGSIDIQVDLVVEKVHVRPSTACIADINTSKPLNAPDMPPNPSIELPSVGEEVLSSLARARHLEIPTVEECMAGTRQDILNIVIDWIRNDSAPNILWISGYPGVGKSAIAASVTSHLRQQKRLGSSFFFRRENANIMTPQTLWRTVAVDLARRYSPFRKALVGKLTADPDIPSISNIVSLFNHLIRDPFLSNNWAPTQGIPVVVVDALDECGGLEGRSSDHRKHLMESLKLWATLPATIKIVVTSRDESDIRRALLGINQPIEIPVGINTSQQSFEDIFKFLHSQFVDIANEYPSLNGWPGSDVVQDLANRASGLFLWAKTVMRFITRGEPRQELALLLKQQDTASDMGSLYSQILLVAFPTPRREVIDTFQCVFGAIIFAKLPLSSLSLAELLSMDLSQIDYICDRLRSVIEPGNILKINHQSFVDFLLDGKACPDIFIIKQNNEERRLALGSLLLLKRSLRFNICDLDSSHLRNAEVPNIELRVNEAVSPALNYASRYWVDHLTFNYYETSFGDILHYFIYAQFLFWLEVMSLKKQMNSVAGILQALITWMKVSGQDIAMVADMLKFVSAFAYAMSQSAPHIYLSALPFSPRNSAIFKHYINLYPNTLTIQNGGENDWPAIQNVLTGHRGTVRSVAVSPDGKLIASGSEDMVIRLWDVETGETIGQPLEGCGSQIVSVAFSPNGRRVVSGSYDMTIRMWDTETGQPVGDVLIGHDDWVNSVAFSPDGRRIASGSDDSTICLWDAETGKVIGQPLVGHSGDVISVTFSPDGRFIASGSGDTTVRLWNVETGHPSGDSLKGHTDWVMSVAFSHNGRRIVSGSRDCTIRLWDINSGEVAVRVFRCHDNGVASVSFSPDGEYIVSGSWDRRVLVLNAEAGDVVGGPFEGHTSLVTSVTFSPDARRIISGSGDRTIRIWDAEAQKPDMNLYEGHDDCITCISFSPDGKYIISGSNIGNVCVWCIKTGSLVGKPFIHSDGISSAALSLDNKWVASGSEDTMVCIWSMETKESVGQPFEGHTDSVTCVVFLPNGKRIVSGSDDTTICVWDIEKGVAIGRPLEGHSDGVISVAFIADGRKIISGSRDKTIRVWDVESGEQLERVFVHILKSVEPIAFSLHNRHIASSHDGLTISVWDMEREEALHPPFEGHNDQISSIAFSSDGNQIVSGSIYGRIRAWTIDPIPVAYPGQSIQYFSDHSKIVDGWILGQNSELLFWVPPSLREGLFRPSNTLIIGRFPKTELNFQSFAYGRSWTACRQREV